MSLPPVQPPQRAGIVVYTTSRNGVPVAERHVPFQQQLPQLLGRLSQVQQQLQQHQQRYGLQRQAFLQNRAQLLQIERNLSLDDLRKHYALQVHLFLIEQQIFQNLRPFSPSLRRSPEVEQRLLDHIEQDASSDPQQFFQELQPVLQIEQDLQQRFQAVQGALPQLFESFQKLRADEQQFHPDFLALRQTQRQIQHIEAHFHRDLQNLRSQEQQILYETMQLYRHQAQRSLDTHGTSPLFRAVVALNHDPAHPDGEAIRRDRDRHFFGDTPQ